MSVEDVIVRRLLQRVTVASSSLVFRCSGCDCTIKNLALALYLLDIPYYWALQCTVKMSEITKEKSRKIA
jgi:hypothetical protein